MFRGQPHGRFRPFRHAWWSLEGMRGKRGDNPLYRQYGYVEARAAS